MLNKLWPFQSEDDVAQGYQLSVMFPLAEPDFHYNYVPVIVVVE